MLISYHNDEKQEETKKAENDVKNIAVEKKKKDFSQKDQTGVTVEGVDNLLIRFSKCCNPVPGDDIVGFITKGRGISVHRADCINVLSLPPEERARCIDVVWDEAKQNKSYNADVTIIADDRKGLFSDLSRVCEDMDVHITGVNAKSSKEQVVTITMTLSISNKSQMEKILRSLKNVQGVNDVYRAKT
jgi:GTP pyrophosphokinase